MHFKMNLLNLYHFAVLNLSETISILSEWNSLRKSEYLRRCELDSIQKIKIKKLMSVASKNVKYWKQILPSLGEDEFTGVMELLQKLPILTKQIIRENNQLMFSEVINKYISASTSGTTGHPLNIRRDLKCNAITKAATWRARRCWKIEPYDKEVYLISFGKGSFLGRLRMRMGRKILEDAFPSSKIEKNKIVKRIFKYKPKAIEGFPSGLVDLATGNGVKFEINIPVVITTGEMLYKDQRLLLENFFSGKVYSYYGSNEIGSIAYECEYQRLHVCEEHVIVEIVDEEGRHVVDKPGRVLVTDLDNMAMPFIRYDIGDVATLSESSCPCGRKSKIITELLGRTQDYLSGIEGRRLPATQLAGSLKGLKAVGNIQFIQRSESTINLYYTGVGEQCLKEIKLIKQHLLSRLGNDIQIIEAYKESIPKTNRGKQLLIVRNI